MEPHSGKLLWLWLWLRLLLPLLLLLLWLRLWLRLWLWLCSKTRPPCSRMRPLRARSGTCERQQPHACEPCAAEGEAV